MHPLFNVFYDVVIIWLVFLSDVKFMLCGLFVLSYVCCVP